MPSPTALTGILAVPLLANIAHDLIGFVEREWLAAMKNPYAALLPQRRTTCTGRNVRWCLRTQGPAITGS